MVESLMADMRSISNPVRSIWIAQEAGLSRTISLKKQRTYRVLLNTDLIDGDEGSDEEADDDKDGSVLDDERSEFGYGDLEEQLLSDDSSEEEGSQDELDDAVLGAEDGEGAADTEEDYGDYAEY
jgi:hypothetical protein